MVLEAKAAGVPSVVCDSGALAELISHKEDGWICGDFSPDALADGIEFFLSSPSRAADAGLNARASLRRYDAGLFTGRWAAAFDVHTEPPQHEPVLSLPVLASSLLSCPAAPFESRPTAAVHERTPS